MKNSLRLTYRDGHPVFIDRERLLSGPVLTLKFGKCYYGNDLQTCLARYILRLSPAGCSIVKMESSGYLNYSLSRYHRLKIQQHHPAQAVISWHDPAVLATGQRINLAIEKGKTLDLSDFLTYWRVRMDQSFAFTVDDGNLELESSPRFRKIPISNNYGVDLWEARLERMGKIVRLSYRDRQPVFDLEGVGFGSELHLSFGIVHFPDFSFPMVDYFLRLSPDGCSIKRWLCHWIIGESPDDPLQWAKQHDPVILEIGQCINRSILKEDTLDLSSYLEIWSQKDKDFNFCLFKTTVSMPTAYSQKKPIPNDYGLDFWEAVPSSPSEEANHVE